MADETKVRSDVEDDEDREEQLDEFEVLERRDEELSGKASISKALLALYDDVEKGFDDQRERADLQMDDWEIYNCKLGNKQFYSGNAQLYMPIVHNAVEARKTRFTNQVFPQTGRYVDCLSSDGTKPYALMSLLEAYIRKARLRTQVMPALMKNGDVEGQYSIYVRWRKRKRFVVQRVEKPALLDAGLGGEGVELPGETVEDIEEETLTHGAPTVEVIADSDILVLPQTCDSIDEALDEGGSVTIMRRWSKTRIKQAMRDGDITKSAGGKLLKEMNKDNKQGGAEKIDKAKKMVDAAGIHRGARGSYALVYETWTMLMVGNERRICRAFFGGADNVLGCKRNPWWSDHLPLLSAPVDKVQGAFKGQSKFTSVRDLQYLANDTINEGADSAAYALMPIVMTDPEKNPRIGSMILSMAAIWETSPNDTKFAEFPKMWKEALEMVASIKSEIFQALSVNPAAITQSNSLKKQNQAEVAQNQQVDILTTADAVTVLEESILTPLLQRFIELDHQYRDKEITIAQYGEMGQRAKLETIPPVQFDRHYVFRWLGVESAKEAARIQQQIAAVNVARGIPPDLLGGYKLNLVPMVSALVENAFGPRLAPLVFVSPEMQMPVPVEEENLMLDEGFEVPTHEMDDDKQHIQAHMMAMKLRQNNQKKFLAHIWKHQQQAQRKQMQAQQAQLAAMQGQQGVPGGAGPGVAGTPRMGAQAGAPRNAQNPAGAIHPDRMPLSMPRNM
jgi:hypothetical protein